jgi:hypothetical protein
MHLYALVAASVMLSGVHGLVWFGFMVFNATFFQQ